jgi:uncharacterized protein YbjQ (UPF0145 family)
MEQLIIFMVFITLGYTAGTIAEKKHYSSIKRREKMVLRRPVVNFGKNARMKKEVEKSHLVYGSAVISVDYFKRFLAGLRNIFGGKVKSYESLVDRARREAVLRMQAMAGGADIIFNVRIETSTIGQSANRRKSLGSIEALAYGTAVVFKK